MLAQYLHLAKLPLLGCLRCVHHVLLIFKILGIILEGDLQLNELRESQFDAENAAAILKLELTKGLI